MPSDRLKILFLCTGNACRSQMAEGWARHLRGDRLEPYSAGTQPHGLDVRAVRAMAEAGVDISGHRSKSVQDLAGVRFDYVVTVCDQAREACPLFLGKTKVMHVGFEDPPHLARGPLGRGGDGPLSARARPDPRVRRDAAGRAGEVVEDYVTLA